MAFVKGIGHIKTSSNLGYGELHFTRHLYIERGINATIFLPVTDKL